MIVAPEWRGRGVAPEIYGELFAAAAWAGHDLVACEVSIEPPNPGSLTFYGALGFTAFGRSRLPEGGKLVSYLRRRLGRQNEAPETSGSS